MSNNDLFEKEFEIKWLKLSADIDKKFDDFILELNCNGTEFSRNIKKELLEAKRQTELELKEIWSYVKSHLVSIEQGQKILYDPKDGLIPKVLKKAGAAVDMARDAAECTAESQKSAALASKSAEITKITCDEIKQSSREIKINSRTTMYTVAGTFLGIVIATLGLYFSVLNKTDESLKAQIAMVRALEEKIKQDSENQNRTESKMDSLYLVLDKKNRR